MKKQFKLSTLSVAYDDSKPLLERVARAVQIPSAEISNLRIERQSLDARKKDNIRRVLTLVIECEESRISKGNTRLTPWLEPEEPPSAQLKIHGRPVIIGAGPAGQFAALGLVRRGYRPIILERGQPLEQRRLDVRELWLRRRFDPESNVQYGEGGAGTFSDGKLTSRGSSWYTREILREMVKLGAPEAILSSHLPHLGTEGIRRLSRRLRAELEAAGVEFRFASRVDEFLFREQHGERQITGVKLRGGEVIDTSTVLLAIGHSARDTLLHLAHSGASMQAKPFAMGLRVEHPRAWVDEQQYGRRCNFAITGSATYKLTAKGRHGQGVYSFCMCPGGMVLPAPSEHEHLVVNGMSWQKRSMAFSNAALVVGLSVEQIQKWASRIPTSKSDPFQLVHQLGTTGMASSGASIDVFAGIRLQRHLEAEAFAMCDTPWNAPAQRVRDYMRRQTASDLPESSYRPALSATRLDKRIPSELAVPLADGISRFDRQMPGFIAEGVLIYPETRTSSPVRILRDADRRESPSLKGLFPLGEGAGYAGGIISSAADGLRTALNFTHSA
jgi:uncharacterized protein